MSGGLEQLSTELDDIREDLSSQVESDTKIDESIDKFKKSLEEKEKSKQIEALDNLRTEIADYLSEKEGSLDTAKKERLKNIQENLDNYSSQIQSLKEEIQKSGGGFEKITDEDIVEGLEQESSNEEKASMWQNPTKWFKQTFLSGSIFTTITHTVEGWFGSPGMGPDYQKVGKFFEKTWFGESAEKADSIKDMMDAVKDVKYSEFEDKINEMMKDAEDEWGWWDTVSKYAERIVDVLPFVDVERDGLSKDQKESVKYLITFIKENRDLISKKLGDKKGNATMKDVFNILFDNNLTDYTRNYAMPIAGVKVKTSA